MTLWQPVMTWIPWLALLHEGGAVGLARAMTTTPWQAAIRLAIAVHGHSVANSLSAMTWIPWLAPLHKRGAVGLARAMTTTPWQAAVLLAGVWTPTTMTRTPRRLHRWCLSTTMLATLHLIRPDSKPRRADRFHWIVGTHASSSVHCKIPARVWSRPRRPQICRRDNTLTWAFSPNQNTVSP